MTQFKVEQLLVITNDDQMSFCHIYNDFIKECFRPNSMRKFRHLTTRY